MSIFIGVTPQEVAKMEAAIRRHHIKENGIAIAKNIKAEIRVARIGDDGVYYASAIVKGYAFAPSVASSYVFTKSNGEFTVEW